MLLRNNPKRTIVICAVVAGLTMAWLAIRFMASTRTPAAPDVDSPVELAGSAFEEAEALFMQDPKWLGTDGANSTPLGNDRIFWSFEDTFVATSDALVRTQSTMVRNSIAIQTGHDPLTAKMTFHWGRNEDGSPASFFPEDGEVWYWTGGALRLDEGPLVSFLFRIAATPGQGLGFSNAGFAIAIISNPDDSPAKWETRIVNGTPSTFDAVPATAVVRQGEYVVGLALEQKGERAGALVRYSTGALAAGDISHPEWWAGEQVGWVAEADLGPAGPEFVIDDAGAESSIHWDERIQAFVHIATYGFGRAWIGMRTAPLLTGPWSDAVPVYLPPEMDRTDTFIYSAIAHPEVVAANPDELIVTYATNARKFEDLFTEDGSKNIYWPRVISVRVSDVEY